MVVLVAATLVAALVTGCPRSAKQTTPAEGDPTAPPATQVELARRFPAEPTVYRCRDADISQIKQVGGVVPDDLEPTERETTFAIDEHAVTEIDASGRRREYRLTEFEFPPLNGYSLGPTYLDCEVECKKTFDRDTGTERPAVVLLDDLVYVFASFDVTEGDMFFNYVCARGDAQAKLRSLNADGHRSKLFSYNDAREQIARLAMRAHDEAIQLAAKAKEEAGWEAEAQAEAEAARLEREAKLAAEHAAMARGQQLQPPHDLPPGFEQLLAEQDHPLAAGPPVESYGRESAYRSGGNPDSGRSPLQRAARGWHLDGHPQRRIDLPRAVHRRGPHR